MARIDKGSLLLALAVIVFLLLMFVLLATKCSSTLLTKLAETTITTGESL